METKYSVPKLEKWDLKWCFPRVWIEIEQFLVFTACTMVRFKWCTHKWHTNENNVLCIYSF